MLFNTLISIFLALFFFLSLKRCDWAIKGIVFFLPAYLVKFSAFGLPTNLLEGMVAALFLSQLTNLDIKKIVQKIYKNKVLFWGLILLVAGLVVSTVFSSDPKISLGVIRGWFLVPLLFSLIIADKIDKKTAPDLLKTLFYSGAIVSAISIFFLFWGQTTYDGRAFGIFNHPNFLAMYLVPCFLAGLPVFIRKKSTKQFYLPIFSILIFIAIISTQSIGGLTALFVSFVLYVLLSKDLSKKQKTYLLSAILLLLIIISTILSPKINALIESDRSSLQSRITIWGSATMVLKDNWLFGIGPGNFQTYYLEYQRHFPPYLEWSSPQPHSLFLAFWVQLGAFGFAGFSLILLWFYKVAAGVLKREVLSTTLIAIMSAVLVHGLVDTTYWKNDLSMMFWLLVGLMIVISHDHLPSNYKLKE